MVSRITPGHDLVVHPREDSMVIATHERGRYAFEIRPNEEFVEEKGEADEEAEAKKYPFLSPRPQKPLASRVMK
jgi:hypothetical protein